jgi:hypothetical protein
MWREDPIMKAGYIHSVTIWQWLAPHSASGLKLEIRQDF